VGWALRVTRRCWRDDLRQATESPSPARLAPAELIVRDFLNQRGLEPDGTEGPIVTLGPAFMKLKASRWRGVTVHELEPAGVRGVQDPDYRWPGVVWLCGVGYRKDGDPDDAYKHFERIGADGVLPQEADYTDLFAEIREAAASALRADVEAAVGQLLIDARADPSTLHRLDIDPGIGVAICVFARHGYRILVLPTIDAARRPVSEELQALLVGEIFPGVRVEDLDAPDPRTVRDIVAYDLRSGEYAFSFRYKRP